VERKTRHSFALSNATSSGSTEANQTKPKPIPNQPKPTLLGLKDQSRRVLAIESQTASKTHQLTLTLDSKL